RLVGGCGGTSPEHIKQIKAAVRAGTAAHAEATAAAAATDARARSTTPGSSIAAPPIRREQKSRLANELARGRFVLGVELLPPRGVEAEPAIQRGRAVKRYGVGFGNIPDRQRPGARVSALSLAVLL